MPKEIKMHCDSGVENGLAAPDDIIQEQGSDIYSEPIPLLPIRDTVYFPHMIFPLFVGREKSINAVDQSISHKRLVLLAAQKEVSIEDPSSDDIHSVALMAEIMQTSRVPDGTLRVVLQGISRVRISEFTQTSPFFAAKISPLDVIHEDGIEIDALMRNAISEFEHIVDLNKSIPPEALVSVTNIIDPDVFTDSIVPYLQVRMEVKQDLLETLSVKERLKKLNILLAKELEILNVQRTIRDRVEKEVGASQKEFILREQLKAIQEELGERDDKADEIEEYKAKIAEARMPKDAENRALKELDRLDKMPYIAPEGVVIRAYLDWLVSLPWSKATKDSISINDAQEILDKDHYGLKMAKERIIEFLAVKQLSGHMKGPILCFVGPPGVGKTSLGKSIARAMGREFVRISLGGIHDEAEIRGHRRTYIGSMPGRIIQGIKQAGSRNPVFMLDEIDKIGNDFRGDPSAALLEALDPEQNSTFSDHYIETPFDLSEVLFITTANAIHRIPAPLMDRMEIIDFPGYIEDEKFNIAKHFLIPKQIEGHGLKARQVKIPDDAITKIIREYTREAGVRNLEREIASICRKVAKNVAEGTKKSATVAARSLNEYLGRPKFRYESAEKKDEIGAATGLAYTEFGGDIISIEVVLMKSSKGGITLTGQLGNVMRESARAALSYVRSKSDILGFDDNFINNTDIHIHVPAGAIPKDGPSAGITIAVALASALTKRPVRHDVAMTGEITLRGKVLPIGGLREKVLAAHRAGIKTIIIPKDNIRDLDEIPAHISDSIEFKPVEHADEVLKIALLDNLQ